MCQGQEETEMRQYDWEDLEDSIVKGDNWDV